MTHCSAAARTAASEPRRTVTGAWSSLPPGESQISSPTWLATWLRMVSVTCWYRAAMDSLDQPISDITVGVG